MVFNSSLTQPKPSPSPQGRIVPLDTIRFSDALLRYPLDTIRFSDALLRYPLETIRFLDASLGACQTPSDFRMPTKTSYKNAIASILQRQIMIFPSWPYPPQTLKSY